MSKIPGGGCRRRRGFRRCFIESPAPLHQSFASPRVLSVPQTSHRLLLDCRFGGLEAYEAYTSGRERKPHSLNESIFFFIRESSTQFTRSMTKAVVLDLNV